MEILASMPNKADILFGFQKDFWKLMEAQGIRDPFVAERESLDSFREKNKATRAEKDAWIIAEDEYIAERSFYELGYDEFFRRTQEKEYYNINYLRDLDKFVPCRSKDGQCMLTCKNFGKDCSFLTETMGD